MRGAITLGVLGMSIVLVAVNLGIIRVWNVKIDLQS